VNAVGRLQGHIPGAAGELQSEERKSAKSPGRSASPTVVRISKSDKSVEAMQRKGSGREESLRKTFTVHLSYGDVRWSEVQMSEEKVKNGKESSNRLLGLPTPHHHIMISAHYEYIETRQQLWDSTSMNFWGHRVGELRRPVPFLLLPPHGSLQSGCPMLSTRAFICQISG
jgi:hypothetical protein